MFEALLKGVINVSIDGKYRVEISSEQFKTIEQCMSEVYDRYYSMDLPYGTIVRTKEEFIKEACADIRSMLKIICYGRETSDNERLIIYTPCKHGVEFSVTSEKMWENELRGNKSFSVPSSIRKALFVDRKFELHGKNSVTILNSIKKLFELICTSDNDYRSYIGKAEIVGWVIDGIFSLDEARLVFVDEMYRPVVRSREQILENVKVLDQYLCDTDSKINREYALDRIKKGTCFVVIKAQEGYRFYPSRFIGYANNSRLIHDISYKDGRITNVAIEAVIKTKPVFIEEMENEYIKYCNWLGIKSSDYGAWGVMRKYWLLD